MTKKKQLLMELEKGLVESKTQIDNELLNSAGEYAKTKVKIMFNELSGEALEEAEVLCISHLVLGSVLTATAKAIDEELEITRKLIDDLKEEETDEEDKEPEEDSEEEMELTEEDIAEVLKMLVGR